MHINHASLRLRFAIELQRQGRANVARVAEFVSRAVCVGLRWAWLIVYGTDAWFMHFALPHFALLIYIINS